MTNLSKFLRQHAQEAIFATLLLLFTSWHVVEEHRVRKRIDRLNTKAVIAALKSESLSVAIVKEQRTAREFKQLYEAAKALEGHLLAAARVRVTRTVVKRDTVRLTTVLTSDSTRVATGSDTTADGTLRYTAVAPPCCAPLTFSYEYAPAPIDIGIGLVTRGREHFAIVTGDTNKVKLTQAYVKLPQRNDPRLQPWVFGGVDLLTQRPAVVAGIDFRVAGPLHLGMIAAPRTLGAGITWRF